MNKENINLEIQEWIEALDNILLSDGSEYAKNVLNKVFSEAKFKGIHLDGLLDPSFKNTISSDQELPYPGDLQKEDHD